MTSAVFCPSCRQSMTVLKLDSKLGLPLELDLCFACHGIWLDGNESQQLAPQAVLELFKHLHEHKSDAEIPLASRMHCVRCQTELMRGQDRTRHGSYVVYRCPQEHGRFGTFASFMVEKGFVRHLNPAEVKVLAASVQQIQCSCCGASVNVRLNDKCCHCGSAFALLDPNAVAKAMEHFANQAKQRRAVASAEPEVSERTVDAYADFKAARTRNEREREAVNNMAIWEIGLELVAALFRRW